MQRGITSFTGGRISLAFLIIYSCTTMFLELHMTCQAVGHVSSGSCISHTTGVVRGAEICTSKEDGGKLFGPVLVDVRRLAPTSRIHIAKSSLVRRVTL